MVRICTLACAVLLACTTLARAATVNTGAVPVAPGQLVRCTAINAKSTPLEVEASLSVVNTGGSVVFRIDDDFTVPPDGAAVVEEAAEPGDGAMYCTLSVRGGKSAVRGLLCNVATGACSEAR